MVDVSNFWGIVKTNSALGAIGILISGISSILVFRFFEASLYAEWSLCIAFIGIFNLILEMGGASSLSRFFAEAHSLRCTRRLFKAIRIRRLLLSISLVIFVSVLGPLYAASTTLKGFQDNWFVWPLLGTISGLQLLGQLSFVGLQSLFEHRQALLIKLCFSVCKMIGVVIVGSMLSSMNYLLSLNAFFFLLEMCFYSRALHIKIGTHLEPLPAELISASTKFGFITIMDKILISMTLPNILLIILAPFKSTADLVVLGLASDFSSRMVSVAALPFAGIFQPFLNNAPDQGTLLNRAGKVMKISSFCYGSFLFLLLPVTPAIVFFAYGNGDSTVWVACQLVCISSLIDCYARTPTAFFLRRGLFGLVFTGDFLLIIFVYISVLLSYDNSMINCIICYSCARSFISLAWSLVCMKWYNAHELRVPNLYILLALATSFLMIYGTYNFDIKGAFGAFQIASFLFGLVVVCGSLRCRRTVLGTFASQPK